MSGTAFVSESTNRLATTEATPTVTRTVPPVVSEPFARAETLSPRTTKFQGALHDASNATKFLLAVST
jgi:hypothetical protein